MCEKDIVFQVFCFALLFPNKAFYESTLHQPRFIYGYYPLPEAELECLWRNYQNKEEVHSFHVKNGRQNRVFFFNPRKYKKIIYHQFKINLTPYE